MYPDKIRRLVIDGVYDAENYRAALWNTNIVDVDRVIDALFDFCHQAGPEHCPLYEPSPSKIRQRLFRVLDNLKQNPVPVPLASPPLIVTHKALLARFFYSTNKPLADYGSVVDTIYAIETRNTTALTALAPLIVNPVECECDEHSTPAAHGASEAMFAIACSDGDQHAWNLEEYKEWYKGLEAQSHLMAPMWGHYWMMCAEWKVRAKWRWTSPLAATNTSHPILVVSTKYDPCTPLADARMVQARYGGSGLLVQDSYGHCSLSSPSLCTAKHVRRYFEEGILPDEGTVCVVDELPFVGRRDPGGLRSMSVEDIRLLEVLKNLSRGMPIYLSRGL